MVDAPTFLQLLEKEKGEDNIIKKFLQSWSVNVGEIIYEYYSSNPFFQSCQTWMSNLDKIDIPLSYLLYFCNYNPKQGITMELERIHQELTPYKIITDREWEITFSPSASSSLMEWKNHICAWMFMSKFFLIHVSAINKDQTHRHAWLVLQVQKEQNQNKYSFCRNLKWVVDSIQEAYEKWYETDGTCFLQKGKMSTTSSYFISVSDHNLTWVGSYSLNLG